ncbi:RNA polymerase sigma factor, sigma-70 family [Mucilaginibacter sp. OK268]|uniref:sigma-70 family RNA polymerase sigma factor n=1 Tax=Mucilaginibacter sp. OK268 TaxID=1881048 RepID=UPI000887E1A0|nr:sigma-70 family RNA polymerase sigma factor [Mucilaginibacter sp. OK268]SDQ01474.1 RNA polymerase sigma factor, sigma-70 family [Mucilaginibacter sp. OK268]
MSIYSFKKIEEMAEMNFQLTSTSFTVFINSIHKKLILYGLRISKNEFAVENIVQDAYLNLWNFKDTITDKGHAVAFLKQNIKWGCHSYFRSKTSRFHRQMIELDSLEAYDSILLPSAVFRNDEEVDDDFQDNRLQSTCTAISHIFYGKEKEVVELYFKSGLTHKQIALRYNLSVTTVTLILDKCKAKLKTILVSAPEKMGTNNKPNQLPLLTSINRPDEFEGLNHEQKQIYHLRTISKYSFDRIATELKMPVSYVRREYVKAWQAVSCQKKERATAAKWRNQPAKLYTSISA